MPLMTASYVGGVVFVVQTTGRKSNLRCLENGSPLVGFRSKAPEGLVDCIEISFPPKTISVIRNSVHSQSLGSH